MVAGLPKVSASFSLALRGEVAHRCEENVVCVVSPRFFISPLHFPHTFPLSGQCSVSAPRKKAIGSQRCEAGGLCQRLITLAATFYGVHEPQLATWPPALSSPAPPSLPHLLVPRAPGPLQ